MNGQEYKFNRSYGHMVIDYYVDSVREITEERKRRLKEIKTRKQAEKYREKVLSAIRKSFPLPSVKTPLNPIVSGTLEKPGYKIEKVVFESRPNCLVTGNLYVPSGIKKPAPGVLAPCGHACKESKAHNRYQEFCLRLVKTGFVVFSYDPISQGERDQYFHLPENERVRKECCYAHDMMGKQMELLGDSFGAWRAWDGIRALDYLISRPEVNRNNLGLTGCSGGGTLTTWLWALDDRFTMAAPSCFVTTFLANLENENSQDSEQCPPGILANGIEHADFYIARAPKPVIFLGQHYDFFDRRGLKKTYEEVKSFYRFFKAEKQAEIFFEANPHGYFPGQQKKMVEFFCKQTGLKPYKKEVLLLIEKMENLWATKTGQVIPAGAKPVYEMLAEDAKILETTREKLSDKQLITALKELLNINVNDNIPHYRILRPVVSQENVRARYAIETEKNIRAILHKHLVLRKHGHTLDVEKDVHLFLPHVSAEEDMEKDALAKTLKSKGPLYCLDVRGSGESLPDYYENYLFHSYGLMLGKGHLGRRVYDVLQVLNLLKNEGARNIYLYGRGQGAILALFTAVLYKNRIKKAVLKNAPLSFSEWTKNPLVAWDASNFPRGILKKMDISDCVRVIGEKVESIEPWGPDMKPVTKPNTYEK